MIPMLPELDQEIETSIISLIEKIAHLHGGIHKVTAEAMAGLVETVNCYYSNLIEGHYTMPADIDRALNEDYSSEPAKRLLQEESVAHIKVQRLLVERLKQEPQVNPCSYEFITWLHKEFYDRMPTEYRTVPARSGGLTLPIEPGQLRPVDVTVGRYIPPEPAAIPELLRFFGEQYDPSRINSRIRQMLALAAMHHRFLWIHPFVDGNGRIARLLINAYIVRIGLGVGGLWSPIRGLARSRDNYKDMLMSADSLRQGDYDGRGYLSERTLRDFCKFFIAVCIDQVTFMDDLVDPQMIEVRVIGYIRRRSDEGSLRAEARHVLLELIHRGELTRGDAIRISGLKERTARDLVGQMLREGLVVSDSPKGKLRIAFPDAVREYYFPQLFLPRDKVPSGPPLK